VALLSEYSGKEGVGLTSYDSSGNGRPMAASNASTSWNSEGMRTQHTGTWGANSTLTAFTIMAWVKRTGTWTNWAAALGKSGWYVEANAASSYVLNFFNGTNSTNSGTTLLALDTWMHIAVVHSGGNDSLYVNAVQKGSTVAGADQNLGTGTYGVALTAATSADDSDFAGTVKDFRAFDTALNASQIADQMGTPVTTTAVFRVATTTGAPGATTSFSPTLSSHRPGDRLILGVLGKYNDTTVPTIDQGWTLVGSGTGGTGATGNDTGQTFWAVYAKDALTSSETAPTVTPGATAPNSWEWICNTFRVGDLCAWRDTIGASAGWVTSASDTSTASPLTGTAGAWTSFQPTSGDNILALGEAPTDLGTALGATTLTATGLSGGRVQAATSQYIENALNADTCAVWAGWDGFTGTASAGLAISFTITGATNQSGSMVAIALRQTTPAQPPLLVRRYP